MLYEVITNTCDRCRFGSGQNRKTGVGTGQRNDQHTDGCRRNQLFVDPQFPVGYAGMQESFG